MEVSETTTGLKDFFCFFVVLTLSPLSENFIKIDAKILLCIKILLAQILYLHA